MFKGLDEKLLKMSPRFHKCLTEHRRINTLSFGDAGTNYQPLNELIKWDTTRK